MLPTNRTMPKDVLVPVLGYPDVDEAVEWLCRVFGFVPRWRIGGHRAQVGIGPTAAIAIIDQPGGAPANADHVMVRIADVAAHCAMARARGAEILVEPTDYPYGERQYSCRDFAGRGWVFTQSIADVAPADWGASSA